MQEWWCGWEVYCTTNSFWVWFYCEKCWTNIFYIIYIIYIVLQYMVVMIDLFLQGITGGKHFSLVFLKILLCFMTCDLVLLQIASLCKCMASLWVISLFLFVFLYVHVTVGVLKSATFNFTIKFIVYFCCSFFILCTCGVLFLVLMLYGQMYCILCYFASHLTINLTEFDQVKWVPG